MSHGEWNEAGEDAAAPFGLSEQAVRAFDTTVARAVPSRPRRVEGPIDPAPPVTEFPADRPARADRTPRRSAAERPHYWGHRQRVRERFAAGGGESMPDYEVVEMLLFNAVPKVDVKPLAKTLLEDFGGIEQLLTASREELAVTLPAASTARRPRSSCCRSTSRPTR